MGGVAGRRGTGGDTSDPLRRGTSPADTGVGKSTLTGALDVSATARAGVAGAFGARAQAVDYTVGAGAAEERGVNAVTIAGKVDFAPGKFDLDSTEGRARLGEETAHALQQSNDGAPANTPALEGEAKQAGADFASGRAPKTTLAAPADLALADDPKDAPKAAPKDTDPSAEVPDLLHGEVTAIQAQLGDADKALDLILKALQRIDATQFSSSDLTDHKLHAGLSLTTSRTSQGKLFQAWLETYLDDVATKASKTRDKLTKAEVKKAIQSAVPPADQKDIIVRIGRGFFSSVPQLYSTIRHEFIHVQQIRKDYLGYIPNSILPRHVADPLIGTENDIEVEPNLWEMENLAHTGLKAPNDLNSLLSYATTSYESSTEPTRKKNKARFEAGYQAVWKASMDSHIAAIGAQYTTFSSSGTVPDPTAVVNLTEGLKTLWAGRAKHGNAPSSYTAGHTTALSRAAEMTSAAKADAFKKLLDVVDGEVVTGYSFDRNAVRRWDEVNDAWGALEAKTKTAMKPRYDKLAPLLWEKVFDAVEAQVQKHIDRGEPDIARDVMADEMDPLFAKPYATVKTSGFTKRRDALKRGIAEAKKANP